PHAYAQTRRGTVKWATILRHSGIGEAALWESASPSSYSQGNICPCFCQGESRMRMLHGCIRTLPGRNGALAHGAQAKVGTRSTAADNRQSGVAQSRRSQRGGEPRPPRAQRYAKRSTRRFFVGRGGTRPYLAEAVAACAHATGTVSRVFQVAATARR